MRYIFLSSRPLVCNDLSHSSLNKLCSENTVCALSNRLTHRSHLNSTLNDKKNTENDKCKKEKHIQKEKKINPPASRMQLYLRCMSVLAVIAKWKYAVCLIYWRVQWNTQMKWFKISKCFLPFQCKIRNFFFFFQQGPQSQCLHYLSNSSCVTSNQPPNLMMNPHELCICQITPLKSIVVFTSGS